MPGETAKFHQDRFANLLFTRMSGLKPTVKFRYLKAGFEIIGDHKQGREARQLYDYYQDLVREIKLVTRIDGPDVIGHDQPFGVYVELHHTPEIERRKWRLRTISAKSKWEHVLFVQLWPADRELSRQVQGSRYRGAGG